MAIRLRERIKADYERMAEAARRQGMYVHISDYGYVSIYIDEDESYFLQGNEAQDLLSAVPSNIAPEDYILAIAQGW